MSNTTPPPYSLGKTIGAIAIFYAIAISLRYLTNKTTILEGLNNYFITTILQGIGPAMGAFIAIVLFKIPFRMSLRGNFRSQLTPFLLYWMLPILLIGTTVYFTKGKAPFLVIFTILLYGLLEEIGWRGFLHPLLKPLPKILSLFIITSLWFVWHLEFELNSTNLIFFGILFLGSWGIGLVADKTASLLAVAAFHSLNNFFGDLTTSSALLLTVLILIWILSIMFRHRLYNIKTKVFQD